MAGESYLPLSFVPSRSYPRAVELLAAGGVQVAGENAEECRAWQGIWINEIVSSSAVSTGAVGSTTGMLF